ncbi:hypothetical protein EMPS_00159 [Entomortierella parvispora]|uniref:Uncharacterized protein n=1 Tax=Entomortierella parvispora TaxID=205924 RepID=A0A9P3H176_9FUNG|nr:hypothetical protein EMPS_00159 [Entomortierella parvispora]
MGYLQQPHESQSVSQSTPHDEQFWASHTNNADKGDMAAMTEQLGQTQIYNDYVEDDDDEHGFQEQGFFGPGGMEAGANETLLGLGFGLESQGDGNDYASQRVSKPKRVKTA